LREGGKDDLRVGMRREEWKKAGPILTVRNPDRQVLVFSISEGGYLRLEVRNDGTKLRCIS